MSQGLILPKGTIPRKPVYSGKVSLSALSDRISRTTTMGKGDVHGVLISLGEEIIEALKDGNIVELGDLCSFYPNVKSSGADSESEFNVNTHKATKGINIKAKKKLTDQIKGIDLQKQYGRHVIFDLIIYNAKIYSMEKESEKFVAMGIKQGKIFELYNKVPSSVKLLAKKQINAKGKTVLPGLIDSHVHFMASTGLAEFGLNISELQNTQLVLNSIEGVKEKVINYCTKKNKSDPIICINYITASIEENRLPYKDEIDEWCPNKDVVFLSIDGHSSSFSSSVLKKVGINPELHNGILFGEEHKNNIYIISDLILKALTLKKLAHSIQSIVNNAINYGLVGLSCLEGFNGKENDKALWLFNQIAPYLPLYFRLYPQLKNIPISTNLTKLMSFKRIGGCGSCEIDGSVSSKTAAFYEDYKGEKNNRGKILYSKKKLSRNIEFAYSNGYQITFHAIGTKAIDHLLQEYEEVLTKNSDDSNKFRWRIDHFEFPSKHAIEVAIKKLKLIIVAQPGFIWMDETFPRMQTYDKYLNKKVKELLIPLKTIVKHGGIICGSSDSPVQSFNPFIQIHGMVNFPIKEECLSVYEAFRTYTYNGAYAAGEENTRGTLKKGKNADFIILDRDPFEISKNQIAEINVESAFIKGKSINNFKFSISSYVLKKIFKKKMRI